MRQALILAPYHAVSMWNWRNIYIGRLIEPVAYLVFLVAGIGGLVGPDGAASYVAFAIPGLLCLIAFRAFTGAVADVSNDRKWGVFAIFMMQGGTALGYIVSIMIVALVLFIGQTIVALLAALGVAALGGPSINLFQFLPVIPIAALVAAGWVGIGAVLGALVQNYASRDLITTLTTLPAVLSAPLFYPRETAPAYLQVINAINPLTYNVAWMRDPSWLSLLAAALWAGMGTLAAVFALGRAERVSRER